MSHTNTRSTSIPRMAALIASLALCANTTPPAAADDRRGQDSDDHGGKGFHWNDRCKDDDSGNGELLAGIGSKGRLILFSSADPDDTEIVRVRGLQRHEELLGIDLRPATGELYALGSSARLYKINWMNGQATMVGPGPITNALLGTKFGFDFNPTVDRIRIVSNLGVNLRAHPDTGLLVSADGALAYATNDSGFGLVPSVVAAAYINNDTNPATATVLYDIDAARDALVIQNPPNAGALVTVGPLGVRTTEAVGFDVAADGTAYASLTPRHHGRAVLYTIDLATGAATPVGRIGERWDCRMLGGLTALGRME